MTLKSGQQISTFGGYYSFNPDFNTYVTSGRSLDLGLSIQIGYGCGNHKLVKPLIVIEGFNPDEFGDLWYRDFREDLRIYQRDFEPPFYYQLMDELREQGYDIVYLDFDQGAGDMRENAYAVMAAIEWINEEKAKNNSSFPNQLLGISMGGLVGRYALRTMEVEEKVHDVEHYISFDSPHLGANIPWGFRLFLNHLWNMTVGGQYIFRDEIEELSDAIEVLNKPATRQMVIYHHNDYESFQQEYHNLGLPQNTYKNVAIASGSRTGVGQEGFNPGDFLLNIKNCEDYIWNDIESNFWSYVAGYISIKTSIGVKNGATFQVKATASSGNNDIYYGRLYTTVLWGAARVTITSYRAFGNVSPSFDAAPGGVYDIDVFTGEGIDESQFPCPPNLVKSFCFIPTVSALNLTSLYDTPYNSFDESLVVQNSITPFHRVKAADPSLYQDPQEAPDNELHHDFSPSNMQVFEEIFSSHLSDINNTPSIISQKFNFGVNENNGLKTTTTDRITRLIEVSGSSSTDGVICVNCDDRIGDVSDVANPQANTENFQMDITHGCNGLGGVVLDEYGKLIVGHDDNKTGIVTIRELSFVSINLGGTLEINPNSQLTVDKGATLIIANGGKIIVNNDSKLIIEDGGDIKFLEGAQIELVGPNSILEIRGKVTIGDNATFTFSGNGRIIMDQGIYPAVFDDFWDIGQNAKFEIEGSFPYDQVMLEVKRNFSPKMSSIYNHHTFENVKLWGCKILIHPGKHISIPGAAHLHHLDVDLPPGAGANDKHDGFMLWGDFNSQT
ncbi:MAG: hypothetical protein JJU02_13395 [Cryomorphaceae bacterium]|nr:hypothetical protein [Cryomorphaceae bacterium]